MSPVRRAALGLVAAGFAASCASVIGADFGDYRLVPNKGAAAGTGHSGGSSDGATGSGGHSGNAGATSNGGHSGNSGSTSSGGRSAGGNAGSGGANGGTGGVPPCVARACTSVGDACGTVSDGCTGTIDCACAAGQCLGGTCCIPHTGCATGQCGAVSDGCQGTLDCGACANACTNTIKDGEETAPDCGGSVCPSCALGVACLLPRDCLSGSCVGNVCTTATTCTTTADPTEVCDGADNDCDGTADNPGACPVNCIGGAYGGAAYMVCKTARTWTDAQADCVAHGMNLTVPDSSAENDWVKQFIGANSVAQAWIGAEDRGGEGSWHWLGGTRFWVGAATGAPDSGRFTNWATGEPNNSASSVGGEDCGAVKPVGWNDDGCSKAAAYVCERFSVPAGCFDGLLGGTETDVDCGGSCGACPAGSACTINTDCDSQTCLNSACVDGCKDKIKDGSETDVDCGGACAKCATGKGCGVNADCSSGTCTSSSCTGCVASACPTCATGSAKCCTTNGTCGCALFGLLCN